MSKTSFESVDESMAPTLNARRPDGANGTGEQCRTLYRDVPVQWSGSSLSREDSILILYGTVTGNAEMLANKLAAMVRGAGRATQVRDMAHCPATVLSEASCVLIVTSTYGDGEPPEDAAPFWQAVVHGSGLDLRGVKFSVLALGNTTFDHFCKCGRDLDAALECHGATRFYPRVDCDVDYEVAATHWIYGVVANLSQEKVTPELETNRRLIMSRFITTAALILALIDVAHAHYVWLEREGEGPVRAYFGEWIDNIREKTGGLLDRFKAPRVFVGASDESLPLKRNENHLEFAAKGRGDVRFVDSSVPPREDKEKGGVTKTIYYAKTGRAETAAKLDLELVPTQANGRNFVLLFFNAPLPKAELTIIGPSKWEKPLVTDEQGRVTLPMPWAGQYVLEITYFDEKPGGSGEEKFNRTRHISSLSFVQQDGIRWTEMR